MSYRPCPCKNWGNCDGKGRRKEKNGEISVYAYDFSLSDIIPCKAQVLWLIRGECEFVSDDSPGSRRVKPHAAFTSASELYAELEYRMARTGALGRTLEWTVRVNGVYKYKDLASDLRDVVNYVAGKKRHLSKDGKERTFAQWLADREYRRKQKEHKVIDLSP